MISDDGDDSTAAASMKRRLYLIECNVSPVLYDPQYVNDTSTTGGADGLSKTHKLTTNGLKLYDRLYNQSPESAAVNDGDMVAEALRMALIGARLLQADEDIPTAKGWIPVETYSSPEASAFRCDL